MTSNKKASSGTGTGISTGIGIGTGIGTSIDTDGHGYNEIMSSFAVTSQPVALVLAKCNDIRRTVIVLVHIQMPVSYTHLTLPTKA